MNQQLHPKSGPGVPKKSEDPGTSSGKRQKHSASRKGLIGAILSSVAASVCCVGPLVILALGLGGAWTARLSVFQPFRPYLIVITLLFLAYAFYKIYRRKDSEACDPGQYCADSRSLKINKISLWVVTVLIGLLLATPKIIQITQGASSERLGQHLS
ncbi:MAG: hypothetical protein GXO76_01315, partial [Calditrichaeota bacterium]|nr:hypothetical protein [Calditrichota bacterium]